MPILYRLKSGKINRKNAQGDMELHAAPYDFVPSPSELEANKFRMQAIGQIPDDSDEAKAAVFNTSQPVKPVTGKTVTLPDDIRKVKGMDAINTLLTAVTDEDMLDKYLTQETSGTNKARQSVIAAIESRRDQILANAPTIDNILTSAG